MKPLPRLRQSTPAYIDLRKPLPDLQSSLSPARGMGWAWAVFFLLSVTIVSLMLIHFYQ